MITLSTTLNTDINGQDHSFVSIQIKYTLVNNLYSYDLNWIINCDIKPFYKTLFLLESWDFKIQHLNDSAYI